MDKKDEKILAELITNSRISLNQLARKVSISREVATYRIKKLVEDKIITSFYTIINTEKLNYFRSGCWIQLKNIDESREKEFIIFLKSHPFITYAGTIVGKWNVVFDILSKNRTNLVKTINEILEKAGANLENYIISNSSVEQEIYPAKIVGIKEMKKPILKEKSVNLDQTNKKILELLSTNSRLDYTKLSSKLKLSANAIKYRIKQLEYSGIIRGYTISVDTNKLGYEFYNLQIKLKPGSKENDLKNFLRKHERVIYFYKYLGNENWDIDIGIIAQDSRDLRKIIFEFRKELGGLMTIHEIYSTIEIIKMETPKGVFES